MPDLALFTHVLGAMVLVGGTLAAASALAIGRGSDRVLRLGYRSLLMVALPGFVAMRVGAEWIASERGYQWLFDDEGLEPTTWLNIGWGIAEPALLLLLIALVTGGIGVRRLNAGKGRGLLMTTMVLSVVLLAAFVVAVWAMSAKPA